MGTAMYDRGPATSNDRPAASFPTSFGQLRIRLPVWHLKSKPRPGMGPDIGPDNLLVTVVATMANIIAKATVLGPESGSSLGN